ncbi:MAG: hypothetical protein IPH74_13645 [Bacteroidetes bacterium]|nr:hypothetical protein [Bacteroidota bacterium]
MDWLQFKEKSEDGLEIQSIDVLVSILINLAYNNPRLFALVAASLSFLISKIEDKGIQKETLLKIKNKFSQLPNTSYLNIWLQRLTIKIDPAISYSGKLAKIRKGIYRVVGARRLSPPLGYYDNS